jgi:uncharacterized protein (TIGR00369 family)
MAEARSPEGELIDEAWLERHGWSKTIGTNFNKAAGPFWMKQDNGIRRAGLLTEKRHGNGYVGTVHGGLLMTFADLALGIGVVDASGTRDCVTLQLQLQFISAAPIGCFLECRPEVVRCTSQIVFVRGLITAGERTVASAEGIWKLLSAEKLAALRAR